VERIFDKWDLHAVKIGVVTDDGFLRVRERGTIVAEIPNRALTDEAPVYTRPTAEPEYLRQARQLDLDALLTRSAAASRANDDLFALLESPTIGSKAWVYRQY